MLFANQAVSIAAAPPFDFSNHYLDELKNVIRQAADKGRNSVTINFNRDSLEEMEVFGRLIREGESWLHQEGFCININNEKPSIDVFWFMFGEISLKELVDTRIGDQFIHYWEDHNFIKQIIWTTITMKSQRLKEYVGNLIESAATYGESEISVLIPDFYNYFEMESDLASWLKSHRYNYNISLEQNYRGDKFFTKIEINWS